MAKYILLDALVAMIEKIYNEGYKFLPSDIAENIQNFKDDVLINIDTFEVKEVDLEKVFNDEYLKFSNDTDAGDYAFPIDLADFKDFAKHFYELGMSVNNRIQKGE